MFIKVFAVIGFVAVASAAHLSVVEASSTTDKVISRVVVMDNRPEKAGDVTTFDQIFKKNSTRKGEDTQKVLPVKPQAENNDLSILRDDEKNRKVRQATKEPVVVLPKELTKDAHTSTTEKNVVQEKNVPKVVPVTSAPRVVSSTTSSDNLKTEFKLPQDVQTHQLEQNIKGHHFGHHHAVPLPYVN